MGRKASCRCDVCTKCRKRISARKSRAYKDSILSTKTIAPRKGPLYPYIEDGPNTWLTRP